MNLDSVFSFHTLTESQNNKCAELRAKGKELAQFITDSCPDSREKSIALTQVDDAVLHAVAAIARSD